MYTVVPATIGLLDSYTGRDEVALTQGFPFQISSHSFGEKSVRQNREQKAFFEAKDRVYLRTKGLQQFLNAGEIPMLERSLKLLQGGATIYAIMPGFVATLPLQVYRWMF